MKCNRIDRIWMTMTSPYQWLTPELKNEIKYVFEPKYGRQLNNAEVIVIATNLTSFMETVIKWKMKQNATENSFNSNKQPLS